MRRWQLATGLLALAALAGCGGVQIAPTPELPKALVEKVPAKVGLVVTAEQRNLVHSETRGGVSWSVALGAGQQRFAQEILGATFGEVTEFADLDAARKSSGLQALFEPVTEQYSFATERETGGEYVAVTIRYRIEVMAPDGSAHDTLTLTGYGTSPTGGLGLDSKGPMDQATRAAMRDAAAKFMVQFGDLPLAATLAKGERVSGASAATSAGAASRTIEALPVRESRRRPVTPASAPSGS